MKSKLIALTALSLDLCSSLAGAAEQQACYKSIGVFYELDSQRQLKTKQGQTPNSIELTQTQTAKDAVKTACSAAMYDLVTNASMEDVIGKKEGNTQASSLNQVCVSSVWAMYLISNAAASNPELRAEGDKIFKAFFTSDNHDNMCYQKDREFFEPIQHYFAPILKDKMNKI